MNELYKRIKERREELGLSQEELAKKLGHKSRSSINKIEKGENDIPQSKIKAFADALETTPSKLMGWNDNVGKIIKQLDNSVDQLTNAMFTDENKLKEFKKFQAEYMKYMDSLTPNEYRQYQSNNKNIKEMEILNKFNMLNEIGQEKAIENVDLLTKVPEYKKQSIKKEISDSSKKIISDN